MSNHNLDEITRSEDRSKGYVIISGDPSDHLIIFSCKNKSLKLCESNIVFKTVQ